MRAHATSGNPNVHFLVYTQLKSVCLLGHRIQTSNMYNYAKNNECKDDSGMLASQHLPRSTAEDSAERQGGCLCGHLQCQSNYSSFAC